MLLISTVPRVEDADRVALVPVGVGITLVILSFMETPHVVKGLRLASRDPTSPT